MSLFQIAGFLVIAALILISGSNLVRRRGRPGAALAWLILWCAAGAAMAVPDSTTRIARWLGIERGADLVFYSAVLAGGIGFFATYLKLRRLDRQLTRLVRHLALEEAEPGPEPGPDE